ncbi:hypothetical protein BDQ17DRAFT_1351884 [Cyathus striatus]|nr:hypothetical protein BDQ17DRAFT_1351884 [Cyathus striatus]
MFDSTPSPSYYFHGSNSSHSKDSSAGGRTYHVPNYATRSDNKSFSGSSPQTKAGNSYANERSTLIEVSFDEERSTRKMILVVFVVSLFFAFPAMYLLLYSKEISHNEWYDGSYGWNGPCGQGVTCPERKPAEESKSQRCHINKGVLQFDVSQEPEKATGSSVLEITSTRPKPQWIELRPKERCLSFGRREYTARLHNAPFFSGSRSVCETTPIAIHGTVIERPDYCEVKWFGKTIGHWNVSFNEIRCLPTWGKFTDVGCTGAGSQLRRFQSRLWNIERGEDWTVMCSTAPATIHGIYFDQPNLCDHRGIWGIYGVWELEDSSC